MNFKIDPAQDLGSSVTHGTEVLILKRTGPVFTGCGAIFFISRPTIIFTRSLRVISFVAGFQ
jgi:hypothetical protein